MNRIYLALIVFTLISCNQETKEYFEKESKLLQEKIEFNKQKIEINYLLNHRKGLSYNNLSRQISDSLGLLSQSIDNNEIELVNQKKFII